MRGRAGLALVGLAALVAAVPAPAAAAEPRTDAAAAGASNLPAPLAGPEWTSLPTSQNLVALTFDAGANADGVPKILAALEQAGAPATFFLTGQWAERFPGQAHEIASQPRVSIGNHTYDHPDLTTLTDAQVADEVTRGAAAIRLATGRDPHPLFRFPFGASDARTLNDVHQLGYGGIRWSVDTLGWKGSSGGQTVDSVVSRAVGGARPGEIVIMHVGSAPDGSTLDADALPRVLSGLRAKGYGFIALWDFLRRYRVDTFARGTDGQVWQQTWDSTRWSGFGAIGGALAPGAGAAAAAWSYNRLDVFVEGGDRQLWHRWWDGSEWGPWEALGGVLTSAPAVAAWDHDRLDVFVRGTDNALWHRWWDGAAWQGWESLGGSLTSAPGAVSQGPGLLDVFVAGTDQQLWHLRWDGSGWRGFEPLGGVLTSAPAAASWGAGRLDVFVRGTDQALWHSWSAGQGWSGWESLGGVVASGPGAASRGLGQVDVFVDGCDGQMWHRWWDGTAWRGFEPLGGVLTAAPAAAT